MAFALQQFLITFLILPGYIPLSIASYSIVGEKQSRSLEAVLATPIRTTELLAGKAIAALVPAILATWIAYGIVLVLAVLLLGARISGVFLEPAWLGRGLCPGAGDRAPVRDRRPPRQLARQRPADGAADRSGHPAAPDRPAGRADGRQFPARPAAPT